MATLRIGGLEEGDTSGASLTSGTFSIQTGTNRTGAYALRCNPASGAAGYVAYGGWNANGALASVARTAETFYTFYFRFASLPSALTMFAVVGDNIVGSVALLQCSSVGAITIVGTGASSTIATISAGVWYRADVRVTSNGTSGAKIDGGAEQTVTANNLTQAYLYLGRTNGPATAMDVYFDDFLISSTGFPGAGEVRACSTTGDGNYTGWTTGSGTTEAEVDEVPHDSDTTYIACPDTADNTARTFAMEDTGTVGIVGTILCVQPQVVVRTESTASTSTVGLRLRSGSTDSDTSGQEWTTSYALKGKILDTDPNGGGAWTSGGVDGIEVGVFAGTIAQNQRCTAVAAMVWTDGVAPVGGQPTVKRQGGVAFMSHGGYQPGSGRMVW